MNKKKDFFFNSSVRKTISPSPFTIPPLLFSNHRGATKNSILVRDFPASWITFLCPRFEWRPIFEPSQLGFLHFFLAISLSSEGEPLSKIKFANETRRLTPAVRECLKKNRPLIFFLKHFPPDPPLRLGWLPTHPPSRIPLVVSTPRSNVLFVRRSWQKMAVCQKVQIEKFNQNKAKPYVSRYCCWNYMKFLMST